MARDAPFYNYFTTPKSQMNFKTNILIKGLGGPGAPKGKQTRGLWIQLIE